MEYAIPLRMKDIKELLFQADFKVQIHWKVAKYLVMNKTFRTSLIKEIKESRELVIHYDNKAKRAKLRRMITKWEAKADAEHDRCLILEELRKSLLNKTKR